MLSPRNEHHFLGAAISGIFGTLQQSSANRANFRNTQTTNKFNMLEAQKQRDWQEKMVNESREYNSPESMIARGYRDWETDRKSTRLNSSHSAKSRMPSSA